MYDVHVDVLRDHKIFQYVFTQKGLNLRQRRWLEVLKDYRPYKETVVKYALIRLSMGSTTHVEEEIKELAKGVHMPTRLGVRLISISDGGVTENGSKYSLVAVFKENKDRYSIFFELKGVVDQ